MKEQKKRSVHSTKEDFFDDAQHSRELTQCVSLISQPSGNPFLVLSANTHTLLFALICDSATQFPLHVIGYLFEEHHDDTVW